MRTVSFQAGDTILSEGDEGDSAFLINSGSVDVIVGAGDKARNVGTLSAGEVFGEMGLIDAGPRSATVKAVTDTECVQTTYDELTDSFREYPERAFEFMKTLAGRLRHMNELVQSLQPGSKGQLRDIFNVWADLYDDAQTATIAWELERDALPPHIHDQFNAISFEDDYRARVNPQLMNELLCRAVPVLRYAGWSIEEVGDGYARSKLPLASSSTNQHGTHQATLMALAADYTGGLALATLLRGVPIVGVHPVSTFDQPMVLWLARMEINYKIPSTDDLEVSCEVPVNRVAVIRSRYISRRRIIEPLEVTFWNRNQKVAVGKMSYYLQSAEGVRPNKSGAKVGIIYQHKLKSSARMIAGVRAREAASESPLVEDMYSASVAGKHGAFLANSFCEKLPQLQYMVAARTKHLDTSLQKSIDAGVKQVVLLGAGLDCRPFRIGRSDTTFFELDLPDMLEVREESLRRVPNLPSIRRIPVAGNFELDEVDDLLRTVPEFEPSAPTFYLFEGMSMYFERETVTAIFGKLKNLLQRPEDRLWTDVVLEEVVNGTSAHDEVSAFVDGMGELGEPFRFGVNDACGFFSEMGFDVKTLDPSSVYTPSKSPVLNLYLFALLAAQT